jgi:hypothetical protein
MARVYERAGTRITAQASGAITAGSFSTATETPIDKSASGNGDGAQWFDVYVDVTAAPSAEAIAEVWIAGSSDGTDEAVYEYALSVAVPVTVTDQYRVGALLFTPREFKAKLKAIDYGFTAALYITPMYYADA